MEQTTKKYNKNWSLTTEQANRFKRLARIADEKYADIFKLLSEFLDFGGICWCEDCPVKCNIYIPTMTIVRNVSLIILKMEQQRIK